MAFLLEAAQGENISFFDSLGKSGLGILIVFIGLICLIALVTVMGKICQKLIHDGPKANVPQTAKVAPAKAQGVIANREELIVAFSAAVAEELGTDVSAIRVVSFKEIG